MGNSFSDFESFCNRLRSNDPTADLVNTDNFPYFESEEAGKLGEALLLLNSNNNNINNNSNNMNSHVRQIIMDVSNLDVRHDGRGVPSIAHFLQTSRSIQALYLKSPGLVPYNNMAAAMQQQHHRTVGHVVSALLTAVAASSTRTIDELVFGNVDLVTPCRAFCQLLSRNDNENACSVKRLRISFGREVQTDQQRKSLQHAFAHNTSIVACELAGLPDGTFSAIATGMQDNVHIKSLRLDRIGGVSDNTALSRLLQHNTSIVSLTIAQTMAINLTMLVTSLCGCNGNDTICDLQLVECHLMAEPHAVEIKRLVQNCPNLISLSVSKNHLENAGFAHIVQGLHRNRTLRFLDISDNGIAGLQGCIILRDLLRRNRSLTRLDIDHNHLRGGISSSTNPLFATAASSSTTLHIYTQVAAYALGLAHNTSLLEIDMSHCGLNDDSCRVLANYTIPHNHTIQVLALARNDITHIGIQRLCASMTQTAAARGQNSSFTALALSYNDLGDAGIVVLADMLRDNIVPLTKLFLDETSFGNDGALALASGMQVNKTLQVLSVEDNRFDQVGVAAFMNALPHCKQLARWDFSWRHEYSNNNNNANAAVAVAATGTIATAAAVANDSSNVVVDLVTLLQSQLLANKTLLSVNISGYEPKPKDRILMDFCANRNRILPLVQGESTAATTRTAAAASNEPAANAADSSNIHTNNTTSCMPMELWPNVLATQSTEPNPKHELSTMYWLLTEVLVSVCQYAATTTRPIAVVAPVAVSADNDNNNNSTMAAASSSSSSSATNSSSSTAKKPAATTKSSRKRAPRAEAAVAAIDLAPVLQPTKGRATKSAAASTSSSASKRASSSTKRKSAATGEAATKEEGRPATRMTRSRACKGSSTTTTTTDETRANAVAAAAAASQVHTRTQSGRKRKHSNS